MDTSTLDRPAVSEVRHLSATFDSVELRDTGDGLTFIGHAAVFDRLSEDLGGFRERIQRGSFRKILDSNPDVRFLINHNGLPLARTKSGTMELTEDPRGLRVYAKLADTQLARDLKVLVQRGDIDQMSFGFIVGQGNEQWETEDDGTQVRTITGFNDLLDVSVVTYPAYSQTDATMRQIRSLGSKPELREIDADSIYLLAQMASLGNYFVDVETDPNDIAAMNAILDGIAALIVAEANDEDDADGTGRSSTHKISTRTDDVTNDDAGTADTQQVVTASAQELDNRGVSDGHDTSDVTADSTTGDAFGTAAWERRLQVLGLRLTR